MIPWKHVVGVIGQTWSRASPLRGLLNSLRGASNSFTMIILISLYLRIYISYHTTPLLQAILHQLPHSRLLDVNPSALGSLSDCAWSKHGCLTPWPSNFQSSLCADCPLIHLQVFAEPVPSAWNTVLDSLSLAGSLLPILQVSGDPSFVWGSQGGFWAPGARYARPHLSHFYDSANYR